MISFTHNLKKLKAYIGSLIVFSFILQSTTPLIAVTRASLPLPQKVSTSIQSPTNINNFVADSNLNKLIQYMVENSNIDSNKELSEPLKRCYRTILQGTQVLPIEDIWQAMPEILQYAVDYHTKAPRPNAPITESNAIVGPGTCDITQLLELLVTIKNRIGCVSDDVCCNTILGILGNACDIFGGDDTISSILIKILELLETQTTCCNEILQTLTILEVIERDVQNTFTVLEEIQETLEECCENIIDEIIETRSILIECCEKLNCLPTSLTQADVVGGVIELTQKGNYKFCENITADLIISNSCISVDMNDRKLFGVVSIHGDDDILKNGFIQPPAPTSLLAAITRANGIAPAVSVEDGVVNVRLLNLTITNANSIGVDENNNGLPGRDGIFNNGIKTFIVDCCIQTGAGSNGGDAQDGLNPLPAGNGGNGGNGIHSIQDKAQIIRTIIMTGGGGNGGTTEIDTPGLDNAGSGGSSGIGIIIFGNLLRAFNFTGGLTRVADSQVFTGTGGIGGISCCGIGGNGGGSGDGIQNNSQFTEILNTTVRTGNGGNGGAGDSASTGGTGGNSGNAILTQGTQIINVLLSTGNAGNGGNGGIGGTGGNAGHGLFVLDACNTEAREIVVEFTGFGGNGGNSDLIATPGGTGGNGGDAVHITQDSKHTEVRNSTFSNTGRGGTGGTGTPAGADGFPGRAVTDLNDDLCSLDPECETEFGPSAIFSNFAYAIADNDIRYLINGKIKESGKASDKSCNRLDNVYVECNVDVVFDFCQGIEDLLECCTALSNQLEECCDDIRADIFDTLTILTDEINNACNSQCAPTPITAPITITQSGVYCLAQDIVGTIIIAANNVSVDLNSHQITATSPGIEIQSGFYNVTIYNGTITGTVGSTGIEAADSTDIEITDVNFIIDGVGITFNNIKNFIINNTQFTNYTNSSMSFANCSNGKITNSQIHTNNATTLIPTLSLITLDACQQLVFNTIVMTDNTNIQTLRGINGINSGECTFENIQVTFNQTTQNFEGLRLENCDDNIIKQYIVNKNSVSSSTDSSLLGIHITASVDGGSKNNIITECQIHENTNNSTGNNTVLVGIHIAGTIGGGSINNNVCANTSINNSSVTNNTCISSSTTVFFIGINIAGVINGGSIGTDVCPNCTVKKCTISQNSINESAPFLLSAIIGINFAGILSQVTSGGTIGVNTCKNCHITSCDISNNNLTGTNPFFVTIVCINLGSTITFNGAPSAIVNDNACVNCSISNCSLNNNICSSMNNFAVFVGINLSSPIGAIIANNGCANCSISNCTVNNNINTVTPPGIAIFVGYNFAGPINGNLGTNICENCSISNCTVNNNLNNGNNASASAFVGIGFSTTSPISGFGRNNNCNNCIIDTISIYQNTMSSPSPNSFFVGIEMVGIPRPATVGGCNNITCSSCLIEGNTVLSNGTFTGLFIQARGVSSGLSAGCNNITIKSCEVHNNSGLGTSNAYHIIGTNLGGIGGANNIQFENCTAKQNISSGTLNGFNAIDINNATLVECISTANTTNGFLIDTTINSSTNSSLQGCQALNNGANGFNFDGTTRHVTITNSQALGNLNDGFSFATTTTQCHIRSNIAQNNNGIGFDNEGGNVNKHQFFGNFAQGNGTNYSGVALVTSPNLTTGPLANAET